MSSIPSQDPKNVPVPLYVLLILLVAVCGCIGAIFAGAGEHIIQRLLNITPESSPQPSLTFSSEATISFRETQETLAAQQNIPGVQGTTPTSDFGNVPPTESIPLVPTNALSSGPLTSGLTDCGEFQAGETRVVSSGTFVIGDIVINGTSQFDAGAETEGTVSYFEEEGTVYAEWGAGCYRGDISFINEIVQRQYIEGCKDQSGCLTVRVVLVKVGGQQTTEIRSK